MRETSNRWRKLIVTALEYPQLPRKHFQVGIYPRPKLDQLALEF